MAVETGNVGRKDRLSLSRERESLGAPGKEDVLIGSGSQEE